jgi:hypothetical protein
MAGWVSLGRVEEHEIALGAVGRFWQPVIEWRTVAPRDFAAFADPDWGKIGVSFSVRPYGRSRSLLTYECRVATFDEAARRAFARYWRLIRPFVGHVMRATLAQVRHDAEASPVAA